MSGRRAKHERAARAEQPQRQPPRRPVARGGSASAPLQLSGGEPISGSPVSLSNYAGNRIVLSMWASWCTGCYAEARAPATFEHSHPQAHVIGVDIQDSRAGAKAFYRRFGRRPPSIFDPTGAVAARFQLQGLPATLFLDRRDHVAARILGETDLAGFEAGFRRAQT
jgi:thiol-disulfide isomerase/thioredoxin